MSNGRKLANIILGTEVNITNVDSDLANSISSIKTRLDSDDTKLQSLDTAVKAGFTNLADSDLIVSQLTAKITSVITNLDSDTIALQTVNTKIGLIKSRLDSDDAKLQAIGTELSSEISATNTDVTSIKSRLDSDDTKLQLLDTSIQTIKGRLDSDDDAIQTLTSLASSAVGAAGLSDSDLKVVADLRNELDSEILTVRNLQLSNINYTYTATADQTTYSGTDNNSLTLAYTAGTIQVFLNGIKLDDADFTATDGTSVNLVEGAQLGHQLTIIVPSVKSNYTTVVPTNWANSTQEAKILRSSWNTGDDFFGMGVSLDESGNTAIIGSVKIVGGARGYVHFFTRSGTTWTQGQTLTRTGGASADRRNFAQKPVLSKDGTFAAVPARDDDNPSGGLDTGAVYMYALSGSTWSQVQILAPAGSDISNDSRFGRGIDITKDGSYVIVGAAAQKAVYVYLKTGTNTWTLQQKITPSNSTGDDYGANVAISSENGDRAIISHEGRDRVFIWSRSGTTWSQEAEIAPASPNDVGGADWDVRSSVAISGDGDTVVFGDQGKSEIYVYTRSGTTWSLQQTITPTETIGTGAGEISKWGASISLSTDGNIFAVGTRYYNYLGNAETGQTQVWQRSGTTWTEKKKIQSADIAAGDHFGISNAISGDGKTLLVGAQRDDDNAGNAGAAFVFTA